MRRGPWAEVSVLAVTIAWGLSFVVVPEALADCGPLTLTALRMTVGTATAFLLLRPRVFRCGARTWRYGIGGGLLLAAAYLLQTYGLRTAGSGEGGFLTAFYLPLVPVLDAAVHRRWPERRDVVALGVATAGIALIVVDPERLDPGPALVAVSAVFWAAQIVLVGRVAAHAHPASLATIQMAVIAGACGLALLVVPEPPVRWSGSLLTSIFFLGYVACALGFAVQAWAQSRLPPTRTAVLFAPEPVFAALAGWWLRDERFDLRHVAGALLVGVGLVTVLAPGRRRGGPAPTVD